MIKNYLSHFLPVLLALDLIIPFLLAPFYKDYNHLTQVMSVLGNSKAPLHSIYNIWLVAFAPYSFILLSYKYQVLYECSYDENGTRRQDIEIYYSFVGKVDLPE